MNRRELIDTIADDTNTPKTTVALVLDNLASLAAGRLSTSSEEFTLPGIGKLSTSGRAARTGRNPRTGAPVEIAAKTSVKFKAVKSLKDAVQ